MAKYSERANAENNEQSIFRENVQCEGKRYTIEFPRIVGVPTKAIVLRKDTILDENGNEQIISCVCNFGEKGKVLARSKIYGKYQPKR